MQSVETLYSDALQQFPDSAVLHMFVAQYVRVYKGNRHVEQLHLGAAEVRARLGAQRGGVRAHWAHRACVRPRVRAEQEVGLRCVVLRVRAADGVAVG